MKTLGSRPLLEGTGGASLPFQARFIVAGSVWQIASNAAEIVTAAQETFPPTDDTTSPIALTVSCYVDSGISDNPPWPQPHFRGLDHLVYATYGWGSSMLIDLRGRRVTGLFSPAMAKDLSYWKRVLLPILLGVTSGSVGISPLHCACVVRNGRGLILGGTSGAGKSTLAVSLALSNFAYLSDDWTYFSTADSKIHAWGLPTPVKLLPEAVKYFPQLARTRPAPSLNGELAYEVDPVAMFGVDRCLHCEPEWLVFIERTGISGAVFSPISSEEAFSRFAEQLERLPACISDLRDLQLQTIRQLVNRECWVLRHGLAPALLAQELAAFCEGQRPAARTFVPAEVRTSPMPIDALRRFTPTPLETTFEQDDETVRVATNCQALVDRISGAVEASGTGLSRPPTFAWRVVVEPGHELEFDTDSLSIYRQSRDGLAFASIGRKSFLACDLQTRQGVSFISESLVLEEKLFQQHFLPTLTALLTESLDTSCEPGIV